MTIYSIELDNCVLRRAITMKECSEMITQIFDYFLRHLQKAVKKKEPAKRMIQVRNGLLKGHLRRICRYGSFIQDYPGEVRTIVSHRVIVDSTTGTGMPNIVFAPLTDMSFSGICPHHLIKVMLKMTKEITQMCLKNARFGGEYTLINRKSDDIQKLILEIRSIIKQNFLEQKEDYVINKLYVKFDVSDGSQLRKYRLARNQSVFKANKFR